MSLSPNTKLGAYEILSAIGAGGMGEVYVAEDPKLSRKVALKVLPPEMAARPERLMRFEREAKAVAALNHPNIVTIYSVEEADELHFLTMELVEGKTLSELVPKRGLPINQFLDIAIPLADAVAAAHQKGITHRDLKPDNMMVSTEGRLKILDFGLAKFRQELAQEGASELPTQSGTGEGRILGTVAYMSPEQAAGKPVDHRTDIFSVGIIFYQMLTGRRPFSGDTTTTLLSSIIKDTPTSVTELNPAVPRDLGKIVKRCLTKDPERRYQIAKDLRNELEETKQEVISGEAIMDAPSRMKPTSWSKTLWAAAAVIALLAVAWIATRGPSQEGILRLANPVQVTTAIGVEDYPSWSPDGRTLAYHQYDESGDCDIWVTQVGSGQALNRTSDHTGDDCCPSWSPDGSQIAFLSTRDGGGLFVMSALAGAPRKLATRSFLDFRQVAQWSRDGAKLAYPVRDGDENFMEILSLRGDETQRVALPGQGVGRFDLVWSPEEDFVAFVDANGDEVELSRLLVLRMSDGEAFQITDGRTKVWSPVWSLDGRTLYYVSNRGGSMDLWDQPMAEDGKPVGEPQPLTAGLVIRSVALSRDVTKLAYSKGSRVANLWRVPILADRPATWAEGEQLSFEQAEIDSVDVSPDGQRLLFNSDRSGNQDLWVMPVEGGEMQQLTTEPTPDSAPMWSPDGDDIAFYSYRSGSRDIWVMPASGGAARQVTHDETQDAFPAWSPDGRELAFDSVREGNMDIWVIPIEGGEARRLTDAPERDRYPRWSPDGKRLAFESRRAGQRHLWWFPGTVGEAEPFSKGAGSYLRWSLDGKRVYFLGAGERAGNIWELSVEDGAERPLTDLVGKRGNLGGHTLATDGRHLYFRWSEDIGDLWVMDVIHE